WSSTASDEAGSQKLGQPVPESYFSSERNSSAPQAAQRYTPCSCSSQKAPVKARSVPFSRSTWYCSGDSCSRHSASDFWILADMSSPSRHSLVPPGETFGVLRLFRGHVRAAPLGRHSTGDERRQSVGGSHLAPPCGSPLW